MANILRSKVIIGVDEVNVIIGVLLLIFGVPILVWRFVTEGDIHVPPMLSIIVGIGLIAFTVIRLYSPKE